jgi:hypothetical protein
MNLDEEDPPPLVHVEGSDGGLVEERKPAKVPITIVTGKL